MRYRPLPEVLDENFHLRVVTEVALLLIEAKVVRVHVDDQRRRFPLVFSQNPSLSHDEWL